MKGFVIAPELQSFLSKQLDASTTPLCFSSAMKDAFESMDAPSVCDNGEDRGRVTAPHSVLFAEEGGRFCALVVTFKTDRPYTSGATATVYAMRSEVGAGFTTQSNEAGIYPGEDCAPGTGGLIAGGTWKR